MPQQLKTEVIIEIPETHTIITKTELEELKQKAEPEWTSGLGWLSEQTGIKSPQQLKERLLYPFRDELEDFVDYPDKHGETWRFNSYHLKYWLRNNFERVAK